MFHLDMDVKEILTSLEGHAQGMDAFLRLFVWTWIPFVKKGTLSTIDMCKRVQMPTEPQRIEIGRITASQGHGGAERGMRSRFLI